jgi:cell division protein FtsB
VRGRPSGRGLPKLPAGLGLTPRALAVITVLVVLALSYANSLRIYLNQENALANARQQIQQRSERIATLEDELSRWNDPAYVKAQARDRLGWVLPGETGYRVIGADGRPLGGGVVIVAEQKLPAGEHEPMWWDRLWGSIQTADAPAKKLG